MAGDLDSTTKGDKHPCPISWCLHISFLFRYLISIRIKLSTTKKSWKRWNEKRLSFCLWTSFEKLHGNKIYLNNIRDWQAHIFHSLSDKYYNKYSSVISFTETKVNGSRISNILEHQPGWKSIHHLTALHGLAICYIKSQVVIDTVNIPDQTFTSHIELMLVLT